MDKKAVPISRFAMEQAFFATEITDGTTIIEGGTLAAELPEAVDLPQGDDPDVYYIGA